MPSIAFDCATSTGWAARRFGGVDSGVMTFTTKRGESAGVRFMRFSKWVGEMLDRYLPPVAEGQARGIAIYEQAHHRGGAATELCVGFTTRVMEQCALRGIEYTTVHTATLKNSATGNGRAGKDAMQRRAAELYPHYDAAKDEGADEADALMMLDYVEKEFGGKF